MPVGADRRADRRADISAAIRTQYTHNPNVLCTMWGMNTPSTPIRAISYVRVSTEEQATSGLGLEAQTSTVRKAVDARDWTIVASLADEGASGKNTRRKALTEALTMLDAGEADVLVVAKLDRLSRSSLDFGRMMERAQKRGWSIVALDVDVDTTTPMGELVANIMISVAQFDRKRIAENTAAALQAKKARGARLGRPVAIPDTVRDRIVDERAAGLSLQAIANGLTADCVPTARGGKWYSSTVVRVLESVELDAEAARLTAAMSA